MDSEITKIWHTFCPVLCVSHIALEKRWLEDEFAGDGITISHISTLPVKDWQSHFSHKQPRLFRDGGNIPPIWTRSEGANTNVIGMVWADQGQAILVAKNSAIRSVEELKGKKVALPGRLGNFIDFRRAAAQRGIIMSLEAHGLAQDDVHWVDIPIDIPDIATELKDASTTGWKIGTKTGWALPQEPEVEALQRGEVDAIYSSGGREIIIEQSGVAKVIYDLAKHPDWRYRVNINYPYICTVSSDFAAERPDLVTRWMEVMVRAGIWAKENSAEVLAIIAKAVDLPEEALRKSYADNFHKSLVPEISERGIEALEIEKGFLREHGYICNDFEIKSWMEKASPDQEWKNDTPAQGNL